LQPYTNGPSVNTASPRIFESAAHRTAMVMFPGEYSGIVRPWEHYLPLEKDFSNVDEIVEHLRDEAALEQLASRAYEDVIASGAYSERAFIREFDDAMEAHVTGPRRRGHFPRRRLQAQQLTAGRSYHVSTIYAFAREFFLAYIGLREALKHKALRRLVPRMRHRSSGAPGSTRLWDDLFRLAVLTSVHESSLDPAVPFAIVPSYDADARRLTLTSLPPGEVQRNGSGDGLAEAVRGGGVAELLWNHAAVGQFVGLRVPILPKRVSFDVGRYDAYGVYRFEALASLASQRPDLVLPALAPLLGPAGGGDAYGSGS
jgi:hypothetical protein